MTPRRPLRILYILTSPLALEPMLAGLPRFLTRQGHQVSAICAPGPLADRFAELEAVPLHTVPLRREISLWEDLLAFFRLVALIRQLRPDVVHVGTPKASLLGGLAAWLLRVPTRVYTLHGLRLETAVGLRRLLLLIAERVTSLVCHQVLAVSPSLQREAIRHGLVARGKIRVLGAGSANGTPFAAVGQGVDSLQRKIRQPKTIGFVGRLVADKGIADLVRAFERLHRRDPSLRLLLVGAFESGDPIDPETRRRIAHHAAITVTGFLVQPLPCYDQIDVLVLPSYREGFPTVALEAARFSLPLVAYDATGTVDAIVDGVTGLLVPKGNVDRLTEAIARLIDDPALARSIGRAARWRAEREFQPERIWQATLALYEELSERVKMELPAESSARTQPGGTKTVLKLGRSAGADRSRHSEAGSLPIA